MQNVMDFIKRADGLYASLYWEHRDLEDREGWLADLHDALSRWIQGNRPGNRKPDVFKVFWPIHLKAEVALARLAELASEPEHWPRLDNEGRAQIAAKIAVTQATYRVARPDFERFDQIPPEAKEMREAILQAQYFFQTKKFINNQFAYLYNSVLRQLEQDLKRHYVSPVLTEYLARARAADMRQQNKLRAWEILEEGLVLVLDAQPIRR